MIRVTLILLLAIFWLGRTAWCFVAKLLAASESPDPDPSPESWRHL